MVAELFIAPGLLGCEDERSAFAPPFGQRGRGLCSRGCRRPGFEDRDAARSAWTESAERIARRPGFVG